MIRPLLALLLLVAAPASAQEANLLLRLTVEQEGPFWVGQRVTVTLIAATPARFVEPPAWPEVTATTGRAIALPEAATVPGMERVGGANWVAIQRSYSVFPATTGEVVLAPLTLRARVAGPDGQPVEASAATVPVRLATRLPQGVADATRLIVAPAFTMQAGTEGAADRVRVGDAVVRTLRMEADDSVAMLLPPAVWSAPEGVRAYPDPPVLQDRSDRGVLHAVRTERAAFVAERPGPVALPGFAVDWLDPRSGQVRPVRVEPLRLDVLPAGEPQGTTGGHNALWPWIALAGAVLLLGGLAAPRWWRPAGPVPPIRALAAACGANDAKAALRALYRWAEALLPPGGDRTLAALARQAGAPALAAEAALLERRIYGSGDGTEWHGAALLAAAREVERRLQRHPRAVRSAALPALNPIGNAGPKQSRLTQPRWAR